MRKKTICVITGSRAEYGLLSLLIQKINNSKKLHLKLIVTGMHLSPEFGLTYREIQKDGFNITDKIECILSSDTPVGISKSVSLAVSGFADSFDRIKPDIVLVLGDRYEIFAAVFCAFISRIPIAHLCGGEITEGAFDDGLRHSITKMSFFHFVEAEIYRKRVMQLGENPENVFMVGGIGIDNIKQTELLDIEELEKNLNFKFGKKNLLITFHPVTLENKSSSKHMSELINALKQLKETKFIFTLPNSDTDGRVIIKMINVFVSTDKNAVAFPSLGKLRYLSCLKYVDAVVGNSSSGLGEVPSFCKGTINIGDRQTGRLKPTSVIDCEPEKTSILKALLKLYSKSFQNNLRNTINPLGDGGATDKILEKLENFKLNIDYKKKFYDL